MPFGTLARKLGLLGRAAVDKTEEALDEKTIVIQLEQSVRDGEKALKEADQARIELKAQFKSVEREVKELEAEEEKYLGYAKKFKEAGDMDKARQALEKKKEIADKLNLKRGNYETIKSNIVKMDKQVRIERNNIDRIKSRVESVKTEDKMTAASEKISAKLGAGANASGGAAADLDRAEALLAKRQDKLEAAASLDMEDDLEASMAELESNVDIDDELAKL